MARRHKKRKKKRQNSPIRPEFIRFKKWVMSLFAFIIIMIPPMNIFAAEEPETNSLAKEELFIEEYIDILDNEPSIYEIQQEAIKYAEVSPEKIEWMRKAARNKAWLPKLSIGFDTDIYRTIDLDRGSTSTADVYIEGPDDKRWGADISLSWDIGELIWNPLHT